MKIVQERRVLMQWIGSCSAGICDLASKDPVTASFTDVANHYPSGVAALDARKKVDLMILLEQHPALPKLTTLRRLWSPHIRRREQV